MVKGNFMNFIKNKGFYAALGIGAVAIIAIAGVLGYQSRNGTESLVENAAGFEDVPSDTQETLSVMDNRTEENDQDMDYVKGYDADQIQEILNELEQDAAESNDAELAQDEDAEDAVAANTDVAKTFDESQKLSWPVQGNLVLDYSMDTTVYYKTLDQYKCNPGLLIQSEVNTPVVAAFEGTVESVTNDPTMGNVIVINIGNGYLVAYGQTKDVTVNAGDFITKGQTIATVAQPTKYFSEEGSHLNFKLTKDGTPQDPKPYME